MIYLRDGGSGNASRQVRPIWRLGLHLLGMQTVQIRGLGIRMNTIELLLGWRGLCLLLLGTRREKTSWFMKLLSKWIDTRKESLVLANETRRTLRRPNELITVSREDVIECAGSSLVRWRGHGLSNSVNIYRKILR